MYSTIYVLKFLSVLFTFFWYFTLSFFFFFFFNDTATTEIYTLSLHDALLIFTIWARTLVPFERRTVTCGAGVSLAAASRSEEHTSELQSQFHLVCRLLLEKKKTNPT